MTGEDVKLLPAPMGDGGTREAVGDWAGRDGSDGPPVVSGDCCRSDGDGEPEEIVDDLNGFTVVIVRRMGTPPAVAPSCYRGVSDRIYPN